MTLCILQPLQHIGGGGRGGRSSRHSRQIQAVFLLLVELEGCGNLATDGIFDRLKRRSKGDKTDGLIHIFKRESKPMKHFEGTEV